MPSNTSVAIVPVETEHSPEPAQEIVLDMKGLKDICKKPVKRFWHEYAEYVEGEDDRKYIYINNGAKVLAVAHLDTVINIKDKFNFNAYTRSGERIVKCPTLDDRLGVYIILKLLPQLLGEGCVDILLTDHEEKGSSTAIEFVEAHKDAEYNWIVEFDRRGSGLSHDDDAVLYSYTFGGDAKEFEGALKDAGFLKLGRGSFTDIASMQDLGVKGFNVAVGYFNNHSTKAFFKPVMTERAVASFVKFYHKNYDTKFKHQKYVYKNSSYGNYSGGYQSGLRYNWADKEIARGFDLGAVYVTGDIVSYTSFGRRGYDKSIYIVKEVILLESGEYVYDIKSFSGTYVTRNVREESIMIPHDVCYYCLNRSDETFTYYDNMGPYHLCTFCADMIHDGRRTCEECMYEFVPCKDEDANGEFGNLCEVCAAEANVLIGDVVVFDMPENKNIIGKVPFLVTAKNAITGRVKLWDGSYKYDNKGLGFHKSMFIVADRNVTPERYTKEYAHMVDANKHNGGAL